MKDNDDYMTDDTPAQAPLAEAAPGPAVADVPSLKGPSSSWEQALSSIQSQVATLTRMLVSAGVLSPECAAGQSLSGQPSQAPAVVTATTPAPASAQPTPATGSTAPPLAPTQLEPGAGDSGTQDRDSDEERSGSRTPPPRGRKPDAAPKPPAAQKKAKKK